MQTYYDELGISSSATADEIDAAFRRLAKKYHPDLNAGREHEVRSLFIRAQRAHEILSDPVRRSRYDDEFDASGPWGSPPPPPPSYEIQPLYEFPVDRASLEPAITLPRMRRRLDPDLRRAIIFISVCAALAVLLVLFAG